MREKLVTGSVTLTTRDMKDTIIKVTSANPVTLTFPAASAKHIAADSIIVNYGAGDVTAMGATIPQDSFGQISCDGSTFHVHVTSGAETDPVFVASDAYGIDSTDISNWNAAEANQNAFSHVAVSGQTTADAANETDTLTLAVGERVTITTSGKTVTIQAKKYKPLVNGSTTSPEIVFDIDGDIIMVEVA